MQELNSQEPDEKTYNADSIKILTKEETMARFGWVNIDELARKHVKDPGWIERGLEACRRRGVEPDHFINRYLENDKSIPLNQMVADAFMELLKEQKLYGSFTEG
jgi:hypothetical protein